MPEESFRDFVHARRKRVEAALRRASAGLIKLVPPTVSAAAEDGIVSGGKRLRPLLVVTAWEELGDEPAGDAIFDLAASVELLHAYSLMHDDLPCMDDAPLRRGLPAPHTVHGVGAVTLAGAVLIPYAGARAYEAAIHAGCQASVARNITVRLLSAAGAGGMIGGQALDLLGEGRSLEEGELVALHGLKTGALLSASLEVGAMAAGVNGATLAAVGGFGRDVGLAFQVMDDVLDATASSDTLGKHPSDAERAKATYVALLGVAGARFRGRQLVERGMKVLDAQGLAVPRLRDFARFAINRQR